MATFRGSRRGRSSGSGGRPGRRFLTIAVSAFVGVNLFLLLRGSGRAPSQLSDGVAAGEGSHRCVQAGLDDARCSAGPCRRLSRPAA